MRDLRGQELEEAVELVRVPSQRGREVRRVRLRRRLERPDVDLQLVPELLDATEDTHGVTFGEPRVEQLDVVPHARLDPPARVDQLEREIGSAAFRPQPLLARDRVDALDDTLLGQLCDCAHPASLGPRTDARVAADGRGQAVSSGALRRVQGGPARPARRPALRRHLPGAAPRPARPKPVQRRSPHPAGQRGGGGTSDRRLAKLGCPGARRPARVLAPLTGLRRARRRRPDAHGTRRLARGGAVREPRRPSPRAHAQRPEGRQAEAATRDADAARADLPALRGRRPDPARARARSAKWRRQALAGRRRAELRRHGAPDRRRTSPLRDGARLRRGKAERPS